MRPLEPTEFQHLTAAQGWLELGAPAEANHELDKVAPMNRAHPDVLEARWRVFAKAREWDGAAQVGETIVRLAPERPAGWLHRAYALRRAAAGGLTAALSALLPAVERFPELPTIPYNLACYVCQMGDLSAARAWLILALEVASRVGERPAILRMALADLDLKPLWPELTAA